MNSHRKRMNALKKLHGLILVDTYVVDQVPKLASQSLDSILQPNYALDDVLHMISVVLTLDSLKEKRITKIHSVQFKYKIQ